MSARLFRNKLLLALSLCLLPGWAFALVYDNGKISGLTPDTVVELVLPSGDTSSARVNTAGEVQVTREENDDPNGLLIPPGTDGTARLNDKASGKALGDVRISDYGITVVSLAGYTAVGGFPSENDLRLTFDLGGSNLKTDNIANNTAAGRKDAENQGFNTVGSADRDAAGLSFGIGLAAGDGSPWASKGSHQWQLRAGYNLWEDLEGKFRATGDEFTAISSGQQEIESLQLSVGYEYFIAESVGLSASLGWERYDTKDSGKIVRVEDGMKLNTFTESNTDTTGFAGIGLSYWPTDCVGVQATYRYSFSDVGGGSGDSPEVFGLGVIFAY